MMDFRDFRNKYTRFWADTMTARKHTAHNNVCAAYDLVSDTFARPDPSTTTTRVDAGRQRHVQRVRRTYSLRRRRLARL